MRLLFAALLNVMGFYASAQYTFFTPRESFAIEISLDNSPPKRLPIYRNSIASLGSVNDYVIGGTRADEGLSPFVFTASLSKRELTAFQDLSKAIPGQRSIETGFFKGKNNVLYAGTLANQQNGKPGSGHIISVSTDAAGTINISDLGVPIAGEGVFSLTIDDAGENLYGISFPTGILFSFNIRTKQTSTFRNAVPSQQDINKLEGEFGLKRQDYLCKALITDKNGVVYGSMPINKIFSFNPKNGTFKVLEDNIPDVWGRNVLGQVESWARAADGKLYGGNSGDGQLFELTPSSGKIKNLGKPIMMNRLRGLVFAANGDLYGLAGGAPGYAHLFSYNSQEGFRDYGNPQFNLVAPGLEQGITWRGFQLGSITSSADGKYIILGEDESLSQLMIFAPDTK